MRPIVRRPDDGSTFSTRLQARLRRWAPRLAVGAAIDAALEVVLFTVASRYVAPAAEDGFGLEIDRLSTVEERTKFLIALHSDVYSSLSETPRLLGAMSQEAALLDALPDGAALPEQ